MSQITILSRSVLLIAFALFLVSGCGTANDQATFDTDGEGHPAGWLPAGHMTAARADMNTCGSCHGADFSGGIARVSCSSCHMGGASSVHPLDWQISANINHRWTAFNSGTTSCANAYCHGSDLAGGPESGPACDSCHTPVPSAENCTTCHGFPPAGAFFPNTAGKHEKHTALRGVDCSVCHINKNHADINVDVNFLSLYSAKSGTPSHDAAGHTCSNVSCHGGQTTPSWLTGTIDVNTECTLCHSYGTSEYNSYNSGKHDRHVNGLGILSLACTVCHDTGKVAVNHFKHLDTALLEGPASATLNDSINYNGTSCSNACHTESRSWK